MSFYLMMTSRFPMTSCDVAGGTQRSMTWRQFGDIFGLVAGKVIGLM